VKRVVLTSGKVFYDLKQAPRQSERERRDPAPRTVLPLPAADARRRAEGLPERDGARVGAGRAAQHGRLAVPARATGCALGRTRSSTYVGRPVAAAPATGSHHRHDEQQKALVEKALGGPSTHARDDGVALSSSAFMKRLLLLLAFAAFARADSLQLLAPANGATLRGGSYAELRWSAAHLPPHDEEWEAFLSVDGGTYYGFRITPHLDLERRRFSFLVPNLDTKRARILIRTGDEERETEFESASEFSIVRDPDAELVAPPLVEREPGEAAREGDPAVLAWTDGRQGREGVGHEQRRPARPATRCRARRQRDDRRAVADRHLHDQRVEAGFRQRGRARPHAARRRNGDAQGEAARRQRRKTEVTVYGTTQGVRADAQIGRRSTARRSTRRRSSAARSRRCRCSTPRSGRARAPATCSSTRPTSSPAAAAGAPRRSCSTAPATTKAGAARRCCHGADRRHPGSRGAVERVLGRVRLDRRPGAEHRHQVGHQRRARRRALHGPSRRLQAKTFSTDGFCAPSVRPARRRRR
jgi:hypothetical protein